MILFSTFNQVSIFWLFCYLGFFTGCIFFAVSNLTSSILNFFIKRKNIIYESIQQNNILINNIIIKNNITKNLDIRKNTKKEKIIKKNIEKKNKESRFKNFFIKIKNNLILIKNRIKSRRNKANKETIYLKDNSKNLIKNNKKNISKNEKKMLKRNKFKTFKYNFLTFIITFNNIIFILFKCSILTVLFCLSFYAVCKLNYGEMPIICIVFYIIMFILSSYFIKTSFKLFKNLKTKK